MLDGGPDHSPRAVSSRGASADGVCPVTLGFPRTLSQAKELEKRQHLDFVLYIDVPFDTIVERLAVRESLMPAATRGLP